MAGPARGWFNGASLAMRSVRGFQTALGHPGLTQEEKEALIKALSSALGADDDFARTLRLVVANGQVAHIPDIAAAYGEFADHAEGIRRGFIEAERVLEPSVVKAFSQALGKSLGARVVLEARKTDGLVGGFRLHLGREMVDASVASSLNRIEAAMAGGETEK